MKENAHQMTLLVVILSIPIASTFELTVGGSNLHMTCLRLTDHVI